MHDHEARPAIDAQRTTRHHLGFIPLVWIKNLPNGEGIDGACTFEAAIDTCIEMDYQLSQAGRGLKYSSDPQLFIKDPGAGKDGEQIKGAANALVGTDKDSDAKLLEINGNAAAAVVEYVRCLREMALESIHGNRAQANKLNATQSGRAMELLNQPLIWLADKLRISYGEGALLSLFKMTVAARQRYPLTIAGAAIGTLNAQAKLSLRWPRWYAPSAQDRQQDAHTLKILIESGLLSRETATHILAGDWDIGDVEAERGRIEAGQKIGMETQMA